MMREVDYESLMGPEMARDYREMVGQIGLGDRVVLIEGQAERLLVLYHDEVPAVCYHRQPIVMNTHRGKVKERPKNHAS